MSIFTWVANEAVLLLDSTFASGWFAQFMNVFNPYNWIRTEARISFMAKYFI
jgi:hypothetical protein